MSTRLSKVASAPTLREYAMGAAQDAYGRLKVADFLAPGVNVSGPRFRYVQYDETNRFKLPTTIRAVQGEANVVKTGGSEILCELQPHALDYPIDEFEKMAEEDAFINAQEGADVTAQLAALTHEKTVMDLALAAAGAGTDLNSNTATLDLVDSIESGIIDVAKTCKAGSLMNIGLLFGPTAMRRFKNHPLVRGRFIGGGKREVVNPGLVDIPGLFMGNPETQLTLTVFDSTAEGIAESLQFTLDTSVLVFARSASPTRHDPGFMKTFRPRGKWMVPGSYMRADGRVEVLKFDWWCLPKVTNSAAVKRYNITAT